ncbi:hypothetical protein [Kibdelosporangium aridum]|uniref:Uncharacterized protein n=1 Tax=Kibdelosporangium aridum TaxID=2030 RepID=A0A1W2DNJ9_KIBAR|nr:hypothetical protein [Kibdelosporangium aridum]SMC99061.1 hypothetical protein SAMN05661093_03630 [Kibdelosporangium aridum]
MSACEVLEKYGTWALAKFTVALLVFLLLHLARLPLLAVARLLEAGMSGIDRLITTRVSTGDGSWSRQEPLRHNT